MYAHYATVCYQPQRIFIAISTIFQDLLTSKRDKLSEQLEEAKNLRENIEKRSRTVSEMLRKYLTSEGATFAEYQLFIRSKARLIMSGREVAEKIAVAEEQLGALKA